MTEKRLKCVSLLSLREMALRRVAVLLWSGEDVLASISRNQFFGFLTVSNVKQLQETIQNVKDRMSKLELPESLRKEMINMVRPISLDVQRWKEMNHHRSGQEEISLPGSAKLCWTTLGEIDDKKTAEELVRWDMLSVEYRYKTACEYCLEDYIPLLWEELTEEKKENFNSQSNISQGLHVVWHRILKGELSHRDYLYVPLDRNMFTLNQVAFEYSAANGLKTATKYFFQKLTHEEREASLMSTAHTLLAHHDFLNFEEETLSDVCIYLLSVMTFEQQMEIVEARPIEVLLSFFYWPLQDLFLENADLIWNYISPNMYNILLWKMVEIVEMSDYYFSKLFQVFFTRSPLNLKKYFLNQESFSFIFLSFIFSLRDSETVREIFRTADAADRVRLVRNSGALELFYFSMLEGEWKLVEVSLREALLSEEDREGLKEDFRAYLKIADQGKNEIFKRFFEFLSMESILVVTGKREI